MFLRGYQKSFSLFFLIPIAFFLISCCCLKADAAPQKKSNCSSCPQKEKSNHQTDCPHAKIKAIISFDFFEADVVDFVFVAQVLVSLEQYQSPRMIQLSAFNYLDWSHQNSSLFSQNPILRI